LSKNVRKNNAKPACLDSPAVPGERQLVLASTSRYRQDLLARLGLTFITVAPDTVEAALAGRSARRRPRCVLPKPRPAAWRLATPKH
jgi:septum formation protein